MAKYWAILRREEVQSPLLIQTTSYSSAPLAATHTVPVVHHQKMQKMYSDFLVTFTFVSTYFFVEIHSLTYLNAASCCQSLM